MANKKKLPANRNDKNVPAKKPYKNPLETWWGKTIIWLIIVAMVGGVILSFILLFF